jgi:Kiwa protein KwaB-like
MPPRKTLEELATFVTPEVAIEVVVAAAPEGESLVPNFLILNLGDEVEDFFRKAVIKSVVNPSLRWNLRPLDLLYKPEEHDVEHQELDAAESVKLALSPLGNLAPLEAFSPSDTATLKRLRYSVVILTNQTGERAYFFRVFTAANELAQKPGAALVFRNGMYSKVGEKILLFGEQIDCLVFKDTVFIINKRNYRSIFDLLEQIQKEAGNAADALQAVVPIDNFEEFKAACCSQTTMADKLIEVSKRDYFASLSVSNLIPIINEFSLNVEVAAGGTSLVFDPRPAGRWHILRLLDDDYLRSTLTEHRYEVNSKTTM